MTFSLVLTSYDRQSELDRFAKSISEQSFPEEIEILFVAQGSAELRLSDQATGKIRIVKREAGGLTPLSKARNIGISNFVGDIIGFPDDDCWYEPELLSKVARYFKEHREVDCVCTNLLDPDTQRTYGHRPIDVIRRISFLNVFRYPTSAGLFIRREAFLQVGARFNEDLGVGTKRGASEDTELIVRLLKASLTAHYVGTIKVYHPVLDYCVYDVTKYYQYGRGTGYLFGIILRTGRYLTAITLADLVARSCMGVVWHIHDPIKRAVYWRRLLGVMCGLREGWAGITRA